MTQIERYLRYNLCLYRCLQFREFFDVPQDNSSRHLGFLVFVLKQVCRVVQVPDD